MESGGACCGHQSNHPCQGNSQAMKLHASITDFNADVELRREGERVMATIGEREYDLQLHKSDAGQFLLISKDQVFDCRVDGQPASAVTVEVVVGTNQYAVTLTDP